MGRKVKIRVSYLSDAIFMGRLKEAINEDPNPRRTPEWKAQAVRHVESLIILFTHADIDMSHHSAENSESAD